MIVSEHENFFMEDTELGVDGSIAFVIQRLLEG